jgi:glycosyltransferase 2 family protein
MKSQRFLLLVAKLLLSFGLLFFLYSRTPIDAICRDLTDIDFRFLIPVAFLLLVNTILSAQKWRLLLQADNVHIPLSTLTVTYLIGSFYNLFLPSSIGGDSYRIYDVAQKSSQGVRSAASVFADRFSGFIALVVLSCIASIGVARNFGKPLFFLGPLLILTLLLIILYALVKQKPIRLFLNYTRLDRVNLITSLTEKFFLSIDNYGSNRRLLFKVMLISFAFQMSVICIVYLLALALHASTLFIFFIAFVPLISLMEALPISIFGLGVRDIGYVFFFSWAGLTDIQTRSLALLLLAVTVCYSLIGGPLYLYRLFASRKDGDSTEEQQHERTTGSDG